MKNILVTGGSGFLGKELIKQLIKSGGFKVFVLCRSENDEQTVKTFTQENGYKDIKIISSSDFFTKKDSYNFDCVVHMAFARLKKGEEEIAKSIVYSKNVFSACKNNNVKSLIFVSSQGVYGNRQEIRTVDTPVMPNTTYSMAKYAVEQLLEEMLNGSDTVYSSLRLDCVLKSQNLPRALCKAAKYDGKINLVGGKQVFSYLDDSDAVSAVFALINTDVSKWKRIYNIGINKNRITLVELANVVAAECEKAGIKRPKIGLEEKDICLWAGLDSSEFTADTGWKPKKDINDMISGMLKEV